ncbi:MAG: YdcF family protein [Oscillospiraceae bacterium]|nr:YdcF family protein [Oscillospiraceae bacterium]
MKKTILRIIIMCLGAALIINGIFLMLFANANIGTYLTILAGLILFVPMLFLKKTAALMKYPLFKICTAIVCFFALLIFVSSSLLFIYGNTTNATYTEDYLIVLGCGIRGERPTAPLKSRLDTAIKYINRNPNCTIIVSGGQGHDEAISEAEAMRRYLVERGIDDSRIIKEDKSTSTTENFKFSDKLTDDGLSSHSAAFITNDFHVYRANSLAKLQGFNLHRIGAPTAWYTIAPVYLREQLALIQMILFNK